MKAMANDLKRKLGSKTHRTFTQIYHEMLVIAGVP